MTPVAIMAGISFVSGSIGLIAELKNPDQKHHKALLAASSFGVIVGVWFLTLAVIT